MCCDQRPAITSRQAFNPSGRSYLAVPPETIPHLKYESGFRCTLLLLVGIGLVGAGFAALGFAAGSVVAVGIGAGAMVAAWLPVLFSLVVDPA